MEASKEARNQPASPEDMWLVCLRRLEGGNDEDKPTPTLPPTQNSRKTTTNEAMSSVMWQRQEVTVWTKRRLSAAPID